MESGRLSPTEMVAEMVDLEVGEEENRRGFGEMGRRDLKGREEKERAVGLEEKKEVVAEQVEKERESLEMEKEAAIVEERDELRVVLILGNTFQAETTIQ